MFLYFVHKLFSFIYLFFFSSITFLWFNLLILIFVVKFCNSSTAKSIYLLFISLYPNFPYFFVQSFSIRACHSNLSHTIGWSFAFIMKVMDLKPRHVFFSCRDRDTSLSCYKTFSYAKENLLATRNDYVSVADIHAIISVEGSSRTLLEGTLKRWVSLRL